MKRTCDPRGPRARKGRNTGRGRGILAGAALVCMLALAALLLAPDAPETAPRASLYGMGAIPAESKGGPGAAGGEAIPQTPPAEASLRVALNSRNAILAELNAGRDILLDVSSGERIHPASLTKIMTAVVAIEQLSDYDEPVYLGQRIFDKTFTQNASMAGFLPGESVRVLDLLYGLLLSSGAECAIGLAERVAGDETAFAALMNEKAAALGMDATHFTNATGLHESELFTTVRDIAVLLDYALGNELFYEIFTARRRVVPGTDLRPAGLTLHSTLFAKTDGAYEDFTLLGGKTGYTPEAGQCLACLAEKDGKRYLLVTAGAPGENRSEALHVDDAAAVFAAIE